jgi:hypothetical protein
VGLAGPATGGRTRVDTVEGAVDSAQRPGDLAQAETGLTLGEDVAGEVSVRDSEGHLVARMLKRGGRRVLVPLDPGTYEIECETEPQLFHAAVNLGTGERIVIDRDRLKPQERMSVRPVPHLKREHDRARPSRPTYDLRLCRLTMDMGAWASGHGATSIVITDDGIESRNGGVLGGMSFGYRVTPEWMLTLGVASRLIDAHDAHWWNGDGVARASFLTTLTVGARFYLPPLATRSAAKPYLSAGFGPTFGTEVESSAWLGSESWRGHDAETVRSEAVLGGYLGAGIDLHPTSWLVLGSDVAYHLAPKLSEPVGGRRDPSGLAFAFQVGVSFGRRLPAPAKR